MNQFISKPTRYREGQRSNILDLFIVDKSEMVSKIIYSSNLGSSDHICFVAELNCGLICKDLKTVKRNFYKGDYDKIREELSVIDWNTGQLTLDEKNVEESWDFFINQISGCIEKHIPLKKVNLNRKRQRWVDTVCLANVKAKHKAWNRYVHPR